MLILCLHYKQKEDDGLPPTDKSEGTPPKDFMKNKEFPKSKLKITIQIIKMDKSIHQIEDFKRE